MDGGRPLTTNAGSPTGSASSGSRTTPGPTPARCCRTRPARSAGRLVFERGLLPGWLQGLVDFGIYRQEELPADRPPVVGLFGGYFYINLSHCG